MPIIFARILNSELLTMQRTTLVLGASNKSRAHLNVKFRETIKNLEWGIEVEVRVWMSQKP